MIFVPEYKAKVEPELPWDQDGTADVTPQSPCPVYEAKNLPLEHRRRGGFTISRNDYPDGLVVLRFGYEPVSESAILPLRTSSGDEIQVGEQDWPDGIVSWFT